MPATFACWEPHLGLRPGTERDDERFRAILAAREPPSPKMLEFADFLLTRYPDLTETEDTIWADGPLKGNISGALIYFTVTWSGYTEGRLLVRPAARMHGLDFYDPQANLHIPAEMQP